MITLQKVNFTEFGMMARGLRVSPPASATTWMFA